MKTLRIIFAIALLNFILIASIAIFNQKSVSSQQDSNSSTTTTTTSTTQDISNNQPVTNTDTTNTNTTNTSTTQQTTQACIVTIQGSQYDVTSLRQTHSGGDIFVCGTDMTQSFFQNHNTQLLNNQMRKYLVN